MPRADEAATGQLCPICSTGYYPSLALISLTIIHGIIICCFSLRRPNGAMARMAEGSFSNAPEFYAVERWVLCSVRLCFVTDGLNTLELACQSIEGSGPHRRRQETCRIRLFQPPVMRQGEKTHFKVVGLQGMNSQAQKLT